MHMSTLTADHIAILVDGVVHQGRPMRIAHRHSSSWAQVLTCNGDLISGLVVAGPYLPMICDRCESPIGAVGPSPFSWDTRPWTCTCADPVPFARMASYTAHYLLPTPPRLSVCGRCGGEGDGPIPGHEDHAQNGLDVTTRSCPTCKGKGTVLALAFPTLEPGARVQHITTPSMVGTVESCRIMDQATDPKHVELSVRWDAGDQPLSGSTTRVGIESVRVIDPPTTNAL